MKVIKGIAAAPGCSRGIVAKLNAAILSLDKKQVDDSNSEIEKLKKARQDYSAALSAMISTESQTEDTIAIMESYQDILEDDSFFDAACERTIEENCNIEYSIHMEMESVKEQFNLIENDYLRERVVDIENVCNEIIRRIQDKEESKLEVIKNNPEKLIVFARDLTPEQTINFNKDEIAGFVTEKGGITAHTVILAKSLGIPAVVNAANAMTLVNSGDEAILYGDKGIALIDPNKEALEEFKIEEKIFEKQKELHAASLNSRAVTRDNEEIDVCINIDNWTTESDLTCLDTCDGVGLFRTEFIYIRGDKYPSEEEQYDYYRAVVEHAKGKEVIIRTLDIGGDKQVKYINQPHEDNPFMGLRAIRLCLQEKEIFMTQLRAILRTTIHGKVSIMFPMISCLEELRVAKEYLREAMKELEKEGIEYDNSIEIGIMVETPSAVQISDILAAECDFFSIGTNDLIQYTIAVDRMNESVQYLYSPKNIALLRSVDMVCRNAEKHNTRVNMCGEAASDASLIPIWIAMGIRELSVEPSMVGMTKHTVRCTDKSEVMTSLESMLNMKTVAEIEVALEAYKV